MRQNKKNLQEAKIARDDAKKDAQADYQRQLQELDRRRQEQLAALAEQEKLEEESRQRALDRQRQIQELHDQWEEEDRRKKQAEQLAELIKQLGGIEGMTEDGLKDILEQWRTYFGDLIDLAYESMQTVSNTLNLSPAQMQALTGDTSNASGTSVVNRTPAQVQRLTGQGGLVSSLLANPAMMNPNTVPRVPTVAPQPSNSGRQEVDVNVKGEAFSPYIQRVLATALMEIFRNQGNVVSG
jgi:hypothetical protein